MKRKYTIKTATKTIEREYNYIPVRYIVAVMITVFEILAIIGTVIACCYYIPYFYIAALITQILCVIQIVASDDNPDYKVPWLLFVLILPIAGFMLYFLFYSRKLKPKFIRHLTELRQYRYERGAEEQMHALEAEDARAAAQARMLCSISGASLFCNTAQTYFPLGEKMWEALLPDLQKAV